MRRKKERRERRGEDMTRGEGSTRPAEGRRKRTTAEEEKVTEERSRRMNERMQVRRGKKNE